MVEPARASGHKRAMRSLLPLSPFALLVAGCVAAPAPPPAPVAAPRPIPAPVAPPAPAVASDWRDWPLTPGDWAYRALPSGGGEAVFGAPGAARLRLSCAGAQVTLTRADGRAGQVTLRTTSMARTLTAEASGEGARIMVPARDLAIDAMGFSRGRFVLEQAGLAPLVVPVAPEVLRVAEDCRG